MIGKCGTELKPGQLVAYMSYADMKIGKIESLTKMMVKIAERQRVWDSVARQYIDGQYQWSTHARTVKPIHVAVIHTDSEVYTPVGAPPPGAGARLT